MRAVLLVPFGLILGATVAYGGPCPASIPDDARTSGGSTHLERTLGDVSFYAGDPKDQAELAPDGGREPGKRERHWTFTRRPGDKITVVCRYNDTDKTAVDVLPTSITRCTLGNQMTYDGEIPWLLALECQ